MAKKVIAISGRVSAVPMSTKLPSSFQRTSYIARRCTELLIFQQHAACTLVNVITSSYDVLTYLSRRTDSAKSRFFIICHFLGGQFRGKISVFFGFLHVLETCYTAQTLLRSAQQYVLRDCCMVCETVLACYFFGFFSKKNLFLRISSNFRIVFEKIQKKSHVKNVS